MATSEAVRSVCGCWSSSFPSSWSSALRDIFFFLSLSCGEIEAKSLHFSAAFSRAERSSEKEEDKEARKDDDVEETAQQTYEAETSIARSLRSRSRSQRDSRDGRGSRTGTWQLEGALRRALPWQTVRVLTVPRPRRERWAAEPRAAQQPRRSSQRSTEAH